MRFADDLRRQTVLSDYEQVVDDLVSEIADDDLTVCRYGGCQPPISDLDLVVLTTPGVSMRRMSALRTRLQAFRVARAVREYLVDDEIRLCPSDLYSQASGTCLNMVPSPLTQLTSPAVRVTSPPEAAPHRQIALVNNLASQVIELGDLSREPVSSLRETLKTVSRVCGFGRTHIERATAGDGRAYDDARVRAGFQALESEVTALRQRALEHAVDEAYAAALLECLVRAQCVLIEALRVYCDDFLHSVLTVVAPATQSGDRRDLPELVRCHIAAHAAVASYPSAFRESLERWAPARSFVIVDDAYRQALSEQMETVHTFEVRFRALRTPSFPLAVAGLWHQSYPTTRWAALRTRFMPRRQHAVDAGAARRPEHT